MKLRLKTDKRSLTQQHTTRELVDIRPSFGLGRSLLITSAVICALGIGGNALAKGGTAKPPAKGVVSPFVTPTLPDPVFADPLAIHGFDVTGFIQDATVTDSTIPSSGGTIILNGVTYVVPSNLIVQMPANTLTWADFVKGAPLGLNSTSATKLLPSFEVRVVGNTVGAKQIAALIYISQESMNSGSGYITKIDYTTGNIEIDDGSGLPVVLQINDPNGRFGRINSPDARFSVDDANPTVHSATGYPMCVPRNDPAAGDDPLCPQVNRPKVNTASGCRNFSAAGVTPPVSGELSRPAAGQVYCSAYVMPSVAALTANPPVLSPDWRQDPRQQAPLEVGDYISYSGTLFPGAVAGTTYTSVHTIEANVGIFTQPGTQPSYLAIGEFGIGTADPLLTAINGAAQEATNRIFLEASTSDVKTPVDIYLVDINPSTGAVSNRWITPYEMTGECAPLATTPVTYPTGCYGVSGGITTQNTGPQPQRARIRAVKSPIGLLSQPTRTIRVAVRSLCAPSQVAPVTDTTGKVINAAEVAAAQKLQDDCLNNALSTVHPVVPNVSNGLQAGVYTAPVFEYIFPENVKPGDPIVPADLWHLPFLRYGEGAVGPLSPTPW